MEYIRIKNDTQVWEIVLARPEKRNAMNSTMVRELQSVLDRASESVECRAVIIKAEGSAYSAGADLNSLQQLQNNSYAKNLADSKQLAELFKTLYAHPKLIVTQVNGPALAGGCGLATIADYCFATSNAKFGYTEARIGFIPAIVMVFLIRQLGEKIAREWMLSAEIFSAEEALSKGLIFKIVDEANMDLAVREFVEKLIHQNSGQSIEGIKRLMSGLQGLTLDQAIDIAVESNAKARETEDCKKGIKAFLNKEKPQWQ